jgi:release factor glutamine methyltransferase
VTLHERVTQATHALVAAGYNDAEAAIDAELLARHTLGWTREQMLVRWRDPIPPTPSLPPSPQGSGSSSRSATNDSDSGRSATSSAIGSDFEKRYAALINRRRQHEPVAYIVGHREFWNLEMAVTRDTLIPRPETELIIEETLALAQHVPSRLGSAPVIVDVGTGSGCLAIAIAHELPTSHVIAIDVSTAALDVAKRNARTHQVADRISWHAGSLLEPIAQPVDLIVSNPPYVPLRDATTLQQDVRDYEPAVALFSGEDGLATIRALVNQARGHVRPEGWLIFEFGYGQADAVRELVDRSDAWYLVRLRHDLQDIPRTAVLQRKS